MSTPPRHLSRVSAFALVAALAVPVLAFPVTAGARTELGATPLGMSEEISFRDRTDEVPFPVPVPKGLRPLTLTGMVQTPVDMETGHLEAWSGDLLLARIRLDGAEDLIPVELPLEQARVQGDIADVTLRTVLTAGGQACPDWTERSLELRDAAVVYDGEPEVPTVLADFIPPVLERLEIYLRPEPTRPEAQAAAELATAAAARFGQRGLDVEVLSVDDPRSRSASPFTRRVELREEAETRISIVDSEVPTVEITGDATTLAYQAGSVSTSLRDLAITDSVTVDSGLPVPRALGTEATLDDLRIGSVTSRGVGTVTASFGLDQTQLGKATGDVTVDLTGMYSPPPVDRSGLVMVSAGQTILDSWVAEASGIIDRQIVVPATSMGRYTEISVSLQTSGPGAACGVVQPLSMLINGSSLLRATDPTSPAPQGFASLPQALMPRMHIATESGSLDEVGRAIRLLTGLQSVSSTLLRPEWVPSEELVSGSAPGILVASDGVPEQVSLPLELTGGRSLEVVRPGDGESATLRFYEDIDFASLQVVENNGRAMLVASSSSGSGELDRTLDWLSAGPDRWAALGGDVVFTAPGREPVELSTAQAVGIDTEDQAGGSGGVRTALIIGSVAGVAGLALAGIAWLAFGRGRRA